MSLHVRCWSLVTVLIHISLMSIYAPSRFPLSFVLRSLSICAHCTTFRDKSWEREEDIVFEGNFIGEDVTEPSSRAHARASIQLEHDVPVFSWQQKGLPENAKAAGRYFQILT